MSARDDKLAARLKAADDLAETAEQLIASLREEINARYPEYMLQYAHNQRSKANDLQECELATGALAAYRATLPDE